MRTAGVFISALLVALAGSAAFARAEGSRLADFWPIDGIGGVVLGLFWKEDTVYAPGYSDRGFRRVEPGMTQAQVHGLLGPPEKSWETSRKDAISEFGERWSHSPGDTHFRSRVVLYRQGRVSSVHAEFYID